MKHINVKCLLLAVMAWGSLSPAALADVALTEAPHPEIVGCRPFGGSPGAETVVPSPIALAARAPRLPVSPPKGGEPLRLCGGAGAFKQTDVLVFDPADFSDAEGRAVLAVFTKELRERLYRAVPLLDDASCGMVEVGKLLLEINKGLAARFLVANATRKNRVERLFLSINNVSILENAIPRAFDAELDAIDLSSLDAVEPRRVRTAVSACLVLMGGRNFACEVWRRGSEAEFTLRPAQPVLLLSVRDRKPCFELLPRMPLAREDEEAFKEYDAEAYKKRIDGSYRAFDVSFSCLKYQAGAFGQYIRKIACPVGSEDRASARERARQSLQDEQFSISAKMFGGPEVRVPVMSIDALAL